MKRHFDVYLLELKEQLTAMAGLVEKAIAGATDTLVRRDFSLIKSVEGVEAEINKAHKAVDESCIRLLALQQPLAVDLRLIVAAIKINTDLERMGDQAMNIAQSAGIYLRGDPFPLREADEILLGLPKMFSETRLMVRDAIDSFVRSDVSLARQVLKRDDLVDAMKKTIFCDAVAVMEQQPSPALIRQGIALILIARNLEKIGDHATNIAEDVIFIVSGVDVRHSARGDAK